MLLLLLAPFTGAGNVRVHPRAYPARVIENGGRVHSTACLTNSALATALAGRRRSPPRLSSMLAPINHASTPRKCRDLCREPLRHVATDVTARQRRATSSRGRWTWYTGSAVANVDVAWDRPGHVLQGIQLDGGKLRFAPCVPGGWPRFTRWTIANGRRPSTSWWRTRETPPPVLYRVESSTASSCRMG
jgi:cellobiose phosphorylase